MAYEICVGKLYLPERRREFPNLAFQHCSQPETLKKRQNASHIDIHTEHSIRHTDTHCLLWYSQSLYAQNTDLCRMYLLSRLPSFFLMSSKNQSRLQEMIENIRQKFNIDVEHCLSLETVALDVCRGSKIEIDEDVWPVLRSALDEVMIVVAGDSGVDTSGPDSGQGGGQSDFYSCHCVLID